MAAALARHGLPADALAREITETSVLADPDRIGAILGRLRALGIVLSLDDFGNGYSSLAHLKSLPVGEMKIDRSFVTRICTETTDSAIVFAMIQPARKLGIRVVAEGVEDQRTVDGAHGAGLRSDPGLPAQPAAGGRPPADPGGLLKYDRPPWRLESSPGPAPIPYLA